MSRIIFLSHFLLAATSTLARSNLDLILRQIEESLFNLWSAVMKRERALPVNAVTGLAEGGEGGIGRLRGNRWMSKAGFNQKRGVQDRPPPPKSPWPAASHAPRVCADKQFHKNGSPNRYRLFLLPSLLLSDMRALDRVGYELNTIGSFEVCPTNNWQRMLERKGQFVEGEKSGIIDFFFFFLSLSLLFLFISLNVRRLLCGIGRQVVWMNGNWLAEAAFGEPWPSVWRPLCAFSVVSNPCLRPPP